MVGAQQTKESKFSIFLGVPDRQCNSCLDSYNTTVGLGLSRFFIKPKLEIGTEVTICSELDVVGVGKTVNG